MNGIEYLWKDPVTPLDDVQPCRKSLLVMGKRGRVLTQLYCPGGEGKHPLIIFCHGIPGHEGNIDIAQAMRRLGFCACVFHYSGNLGSDGDYRFANCLEDTESVIDYLLEHADELPIDTSAMYVLGHSLGGFVAAHMLARRKELLGGVLLAPGDLANMYIGIKDNPEGLAHMHKFFSDSADWLDGVTADILIQELADHQADYPFVTLAPKLVDKKILMIGGTRDTTTPPEACMYPLRDELERLGGTKCEIIMLDTVHTHENMRIGTTEAAAKYMLRIESERVCKD